MNRAHPVQMREVLAIVNQMKIAGILFVPIPVRNDLEYSEEMARLNKRLGEIEEECDVS